MTSISLSVVDGILWRLDGNCFLKMVLTWEVLWRMVTLSSLSAKSWRQRRSSELAVHLVHSVWNMSSPSISHIFLLHPYCFKSYSIHLKNQTLHVLTLLKLGGTFKRWKMAAVLATISFPIHMEISLQLLLARLTDIILLNCHLRSTERWFDRCSPNTFCWTLWSNQRDSASKSQQQWQKREENPRSESRALCSVIRFISTLCPEDDRVLNARRQPFWVKAHQCT